MRRALCRRLIPYSIILVWCLAGQKVMAQVSVTPNQTALAMAQKLAGSGITILNPVLTCDAYAAGFFNISSTTMPIDSGVVLTTGSIYSIGGYASTNASSNNGQPGDPQLTSLANSSTYDACKLEFDVVPKGDSLRFDYVFGSEEYNNATCGNYNDAFSFFISGPGITGSVNMALVPGTNIPVAVNSINNGIPGSGGNIVNCTSMGPGSPFTAYYVDNSNGTTLTYRGFTRVLSAVHAVQPCGQYHLKLTIADAGNALYDSGVFLKAGSLKTNTFTINVANGNSSSGNAVGTKDSVTAKGCPPLAITVKRNGARSTAQSVHYLIGGSAINGSDYSFTADSVVIPANDSVAAFYITALQAQLSGVKNIELRLLSPYSCNGPEVEDSLFITLINPPAVHILTPDTIICSGTSVHIRVSSSAGLMYKWQPSVSLNNDTLQEPVASPKVNTAYIIRGTLPASNCPATFDTVSFQVTQPPAVDAGPDIAICNNGMVELSGSVVPPSGMYSYLWNGPAGFTSASLSASISNAVFANSGTYVLSVNDGVCLVTDSTHVRISAIPPLPGITDPFDICLHGPEIAVTATGENLRWYPAASGGLASNSPPVPSTTEPSSAQYYVSQTIDGCESGRAEITVIVEKCCGDELLIPSAFTPNSDGRNDFFGLGGVAANITYTLRIFNRWGQQVFHGIKGDKWNGTENGKPAEAGVYFYELRINCSADKVTERKGELTLIR